METSNLTKKRIHDYLGEGKRFDARGLLDYRKVEIETGISKNAEGSARVKLGKTQVLAGVKMEVAVPYTDHEDEGTFMTTLELMPTASSKFESGPPRIEAIEMARLVDRGIRESKFIDFKKLCIKEGEKVWGILLDLYALNDDGNLLDAACIAAVAALKEARFPKYNEEEERIEYGEFTSKKLPLTENQPFTMTFHKIGDKIILDPVVAEEESSDARLTISVSQGKVNALQKGNEEVFEIEELGKIFDTAEKKAEEMSEIVEKAIKSKDKE